MNHVNLLEKGLCRKGCASRGKRLKKGQGRKKGKAVPLNSAEFELSFRNTSLSHSPFYESIFIGKVIVGDVKSFGFLWRRKDDGIEIRYLHGSFIRPQKLT